MIKQSVMECLDKMETIIEGAMKIPVTGRRVVDGDELLELIDRVRIALPEEIRQAETFIAERGRIASDAGRGDGAQARPVLQPVQAAQSGDTLAAAREQAERIIAQARQEYDRMRCDSEDYAESTLSSLHETLERTATVVQKGIEEIRRRKSETQ